MNETPKLRISSEADQFDAENELWETRQLGASPEHAVRDTDEDDKELDDAMGLHLLHFRIQKSLFEQLKQLAQLEGLDYKPVIRRILDSYVRENEHKLPHVDDDHQDFRSKAV